jgi:hypothetical protein
VAKIPTETPGETPTVVAIYAAYEAEHEHYDSLGISVGEAATECDRALWYTFRWASEPEQLAGRQLRLFQTGNLEEDRLVADLQRIGVEVYGQQDRIRLVGSHVRGKCDGKGMNIPEAPQTEHLLEFKSSNEKGMKDLHKHDPRHGGKGIRVSKPLHFGQCQLGMHQFGLSRALYLAACKNTDTLYSERVEYDVEWTLRQLARAERIINSAEPPSRISEKQDFFGCRFCRHREVCHEAKLPRVTCRSCLHSTPEMGGDAAWSCARWSKPLAVQEQKDSCPAHLFIPALVPGELLDVDEENERIRYRMADGSEWIDGGVSDDIAAAA